MKFCEVLAVGALQKMPGQNELGAFWRGESGNRIALHTHMGVNRVEDMFAWQMAHEFKLDVYAIVRESPAANRELRFRSQLMDAAGDVEVDIAEGFYRYRASELR